MTFFEYNTTLPNPPDDPADDVAAMQTNTMSVAGWTEVDHVGFNNTLGGFHNIVTFAKSLVSIASEYDRSDAEFVSAFKDKYSNPLPASWMIMEITSFGSLSMLYKNLKGSKEKREIAHYFGLADTVFQTWLHSIVYLRNVCAHHSRLWNRNMSIQPEMPKTPHKQWLQYTNISTKKTYFILCMINYLLQTVNPKNTFKNRFRDMIEDYPNIDVKAMGFPIDWDKESLWKIQEKGLSRPEKSFTYVSPKN